MNAKQQAQVYISPVILPQQPVSSFFVQSVSMFVSQAIHVPVWHLHSVGNDVVTLWRNYSVHDFWLTGHWSAGSKCSKTSASSPSLYIILTACYFRPVCKPCQRRYYHCSHRKPCGGTGKKTGSEYIAATGFVKTTCLYHWFLPRLLWMPKVKIGPSDVSAFSEWLMFSGRTEKVENTVWLP